MKPGNPIKRNQRLQPLSRDHHQGLLFVWKIRQGLRNQVSTEEMNAYAHWFWEKDLSPHFLLEEQYLLPLLPVAHPLALRMIKEHKNIREAVLSLGKESTRYDLARLSDLLEEHIRFEEREFFTYLEQHLDDDKLNKLSALEQDHIPACEKWENEFWLITRRKNHK